MPLTFPDDDLRIDDRGHVLPGDPSAAGALGTTRAFFDLVIVYNLADASSRISASCDRAATSCQAELLSFAGFVGALSLSPRSRLSLGVVSCVSLGPGVSAQSLDSSTESPGLL